jgi:hypothetical protein
MQLEFEQPFQPTVALWRGEIQRRGFGFAGFHSEYSSRLFVVLPGVGFVRVGLHLLFDLWVRN